MSSSSSSSKGTADGVPRSRRSRSSTRQNRRSVHAYGGQAAGREHDPLPTSQKLLYAFPRGATQGMSLLLQTTVRFFYIENLGLRAESMAVAISACKSLDFLIGFAVGYATDNFHAIMPGVAKRYGRRKPFIAAMFPVWIIVMWLINNPPSSLGVPRKATALGGGNDTSPPPCAGIVEAHIERFGGVCGNDTATAAVTRCLEAHGARGPNAASGYQLGNQLLPQYDVGVTKGGQLYAGMSLLVYYMVLYFLYYTIGVSSTIIPYDALGMELTDDYQERSSLFGFKAAAQFLGYMLLGASGFYFAETLYPDDLGKQIQTSSALWFVLVSLSFLLLLKFLRTPEVHHDKEDFQANLRADSSKHYSRKGKSGGGSSSGSGGGGGDSGSDDEVEANPLSTHYSVGSEGDEEAAAQRQAEAEAEAATAAAAKRGGGGGGGGTGRGSSASVDPAAAEAAPIVPSIRALFRNKPYVNYLWMKVPLAMAGLMPVNFLLYYLKLVQKEENASAETSKVTVIVVFTAVCSVPILIRCANRYTKRNTMMYISVLNGFVFLAASFLPATRYLTYALAVFIGVGAVGTNMLPDAMLADIIDYDELHTGMRSEGTYTVVETNLQQFIEIPSGVVPLLVLSAAGFVNNAGCTCGCGTKCSDKFVRWVCPSDVGYACSTTGQLLLGDINREAPCTHQTDWVLIWVRIFGIFIPGMCYILGAIPVWRSKISPEKHEDIIRQIANRQAGRPCHDPLDNNRPIDYMNVSEDERKLRRFNDHFTPHELAAFRGAQDSEDSAGSLTTGGWDVLRSMVRRKLYATCLVLATLVAVAAAVPTENVVAIAFLFAALTLLGLPWHSLRLRFLRASQEEGRDFYPNGEPLRVQVSNPVGDGAGADADSVPARAAKRAPVGVKPAARSSAVARPTNNSFTETRQGNI